jgi:hypothetical protein
MVYGYKGLQIQLMSVKKTISYSGRWLKKLRKYRTSKKTAKKDMGKDFWILALCNGAHISKGSTFVLRVN